MKKTFIILSILIAVLCLTAQTAKQEAISSLDAAKALIAKDDFVNAKQEINYALAKLSEIQAETLILFIPNAPAGFTQDDKNSQSMGEAGAILGSAHSVTATGNYSKDDIYITLTITVGGMMGQSGGLMGLASMFSGMVPGSKTIKLGSYTGNQQFEKGDKSGTLTIQVGKNTTVNIQGEGIDNPDILKTFADLIDLPKLEKSF